MQKDGPPGQSPGGPPYEPEAAGTMQTGCLPSAGIPHAATYKLPAGTQSRNSSERPLHSARAAAAGTESVCLFLSD